MRTKVFILLILVSVAGLIYFIAPWLSKPAADKLFASAISVAVLYTVFSIGIGTIVGDKFTDAKTRYSFRKAISLLFIIAVIAIFLRIWVADPQALLVAYGVVAAGIAIALQDLIKNIAGGIVIFLGGLYRVGNRIEINGMHGDVIDIGIFNTKLLEIRSWIDADQATGRITTVPNGAVLSSSVQNYTYHHGYLWDEISVVVTSESDWPEAMRLLGEIGQEHTTEFVAAAAKSLNRLEEQYYVEGRVLEPNIYIKPDPNGYRLNVRYVVEARQRRTTNSNIWGHIIRVFSEHPRIAIAPVTIASTSYPIVEKG